MKELLFPKFSYLSLGNSRVKSADIILEIRSSLIIPLEECMGSSKWYLLRINSNTLNKMHILKQTYRPLK